MQFCDHLGCDAYNRPLPPPTKKEGVDYQRPPPGAASWDRGGVGNRLPPGKDGQHPLLFGSRDGGDAMGSFKVVLIAIAILGLVVVYVGLAVTSRSRSMRDDLHPKRNGEAGAGRLGAGRGGGGGGLGLSGSLRGSTARGNAQLRKRRLASSFG